MLVKIIKANIDKIKNMVALLMVDIQVKWRSSKETILDISLSMEHIVDGLKNVLFKGGISPNGRFLDLFSKNKFANWSFLVSNMSMFT